MGASTIKQCLELYNSCKEYKKIKEEQMRIILKGLQEPHVIDRKKDLSPPSIKKPFLYFVV